MYPSTTLLLHCIAIPPAALQLASYYILVHHKQVYLAIAISISCEYITILKG
jgi:hypothetical protein